MLLADLDWRCECNCLNSPHEAFCFRCGAGAPENPVPVCVQCGEARRDLPVDYVCREGMQSVRVEA